jgi:hypothetical protein
MVYPVLKQDFQRTIRILLSGPHQSRSPENRCSAHVASTAKGSFLDQLNIPPSGDYVLFRNQG